MTQANAKVTKLNRVERNAWTKQKIFDAATKVVGKHGYAEASVARITEEAGVAQGTFYNHFENRQELLDQLLPKIGLDMVEFIRARTGTGRCRAAGDRRFSAFFDFHPRGAGVPAHPQRGRILRAHRLPEASRQHLGRLCPHLAPRASGRRDRRLQRRGIRGDRPHADGRARLSQPSLLLFGPAVSPPSPTTSSPPIAS
jgi:AcrR family transcriptional regulator